MAGFFKWRYPDRDMRGFFCLGLLGAGMSVLCDLTDSLGVVVGWPFFAWRPNLGILFGVDPFLIAMLAAPFLLMTIPILRPGLQGLCRGALLLAAAYICFCAANKSWAQSLLQRQSADQNPEFSSVFPEPLGPQRWRGVVRSEGKYRVYLLHSMSGITEARAEIPTEPDAPEVMRAKETGMGRRLEAFFSAPVWTVGADPDGALVGAYDLRFQSLLIGPDKLMQFHFFVGKTGAVETLGWLGRRKR